MMLLMKVACRVICMYRIGKEGGTFLALLLGINPYLAGIPNRSQGSMTSYANDVTTQGNHINKGCWEGGSLVHNLAVS